MFVIFLLDKSPKAQKNLPQLASWFLFIDVQECNRNTSVKISSGWGCSSVQHCSCANARAQSDLCVSLSTVFFFFFSFFAQWSRSAPPTCCATRWESATDGVILSLSISPPPHHRLLLSWRSFSFDSWPVFFSPLLSIVIQEPTFLQKVSEMQCQAHTLCAMNQCFCC